MTLLQIGAVLVTAAALLLGALGEGCRRSKWLRYSPWRRACRCSGTSGIARIPTPPRGGSRPGYAGSYACLSHVRSSASTSAGVASGISRCQRFAEVCSARRTRELVTFVVALSVRIKLLLRVATPEKRMSERGESTFLRLFPHRTQCPRRAQHGVIRRPNRGTALAKCEATEGVDGTVEGSLEIDRC